MKAPKAKNLRKNERETARIRASARSTPTVKITVNIEAETLGQLRAMAEASGVPYQRLLNKLLRESLGQAVTTQSRLDRLEREVALLKRKLAA